MLWKGLFSKLKKNQSNTQQLSKIWQTSALGNSMQIQL